MVKKKNSQDDIDQIRMKKKLKELVWIFEGNYVEFEKGRKRNTKKKIDIDAKLKALLGHVPPHHIGGVETF